MGKTECFVERMMAAALRSLRILGNAAARTRPLISKQPVRHGGNAPYSYRMVVDRTTKSSYFIANALGFTVWYWMLYKLYHEFDHIVGHFDYPDPSKWTDAELGIPGDDEEFEAE